MDLYRHHLLDHYHHPRNWGLAADYDHQRAQVNPVCGDHLIIQLLLTKNRVSRMRFTGQGCVISLATASLLSEHILQKTRAQITALNIGDVEELLGISIPPARLACATLALTGIHAMLQ